MNDQERRLYKRFDTDQSIQFLHNGDDPLAAQAINISLAGLQARCDRWTINQLSPGLERITTGQPVELRVRFDLPAPNAKQGAFTVDVRCRAVGLRRLSEDEYQLSLTYTFFEGDGYHDLEKYIDYHSA